MSITEDNEKDFLERRFDKALVKQYLKNRANIPWMKSLTTHKDNYKFACIQTAWNAFSKHGHHETDYYNHVKTFIKDGIDFKSFVCELVQNSIDHCTEKSDESIQIQVEINDESLTYTHNGKAFGFENGYPTSTMDGLLTPGTALKKYDFREGLFGIGFKSWIFFYKRFKLISIKDGQKFELEIEVDEHAHPSSIFVLVGCDFTDDCEEEDCIEFNFSELHNKDANIDQTDKIEATINSYTKKCVSFKYDHKVKPNSSFKMKTEIQSIKLGKKDVFAVTTLKDGKKIFTKYVLNVDISPIKDKNIAYTGNELTLEDYIKKSLSHHKLNVDVEPDPREWFLLPKISIYLDNNDNKSECPLLSSLMPIDNMNNNCSKLRGRMKIIFDAKFKLERNRKNLDIQIDYGNRAHFGLINSLIMKEMLIQFFEFVKDLDDANSPLKFEDISFELFRFFEQHNNIQFKDEVESFYQSIEKEFKTSMIDISGNKILDEISERSPKQIPGGSESVKWCNEYMTKDLKTKYFTDVPANSDGEEFISPDISLAIRKLPELELQEFVQKLRDCNLIDKYLSHIWVTDEMQELKEKLPLPGGYDCIILFDKKTGKKIDEVIEKLTPGNINFKVIKKDKHGEDYDLFSKYPKEKKEILNANDDGQTVDKIFTFLLENLGGKTIDNGDWGVFADTIYYSDSLVKATVSMWDEEEFGETNNAIVHIPEFTEPDNCRSVYWDGNTGQKNTWIGMPKWDDEDKPDPGEWWVPKRLPIKACESKYIISKKEDKPKWLGQKNCSLLLGLPINSNEICEAFGNAVLEKSEGFIKVDVDKDFNEIPQRRWRSPLPRSLTVKRLDAYKVGQYVLADNISPDGTPVTKAMPFSESFHHTEPTIGNASTENIYDMHRKDGAISKFNPFMNELVWNGAEIGWEGPQTEDNNKKVLTSGFVVSIRPWRDVFFQEFLNSYQDIISLYSISTGLSSSKDTASKIGENFSRISRDFAARFGMKTRQGRKWNLTFSWIPTYLKGQYPPNKVPRGCIPEEDDFWQEIGSKEFQFKNARVPLISSLTVENKINIELFTDFTLKSSDFNNGIESLLAEGDLDDIKDWYNQFKAKLDIMIVLDYNKIKLQKSRKEELETHYDCSDWRDFLSRFELVSREQLKRMLEDKLLNRESQQETINNFSTLKDKMMFHQAFTPYEKGMNKIPIKYTKHDIPVISEEFFDKYLRPHRVGVQEVYHGWAPSERFRVIGSHFSRCLKIGEEYGLDKGKLLIHNSLEGEKEHLSSDSDKYEDTPEQWRDSFELFKNFINERKNTEYKIKYRRVKPDEKSKMFTSNLTIGKGGWDIRLDLENKILYMLNSEGRKPSLLLAETLGYACEKVLKIFTNEPRIMDYFVEFCFEQEDNYNDVFANLQIWTDKYTNTDFESYLDKCKPGKIADIFDEIKNGLREIWDSKGRPAPDSIGEQLLTMRFRKKSNDGYDTGNFTPTKMETLFNEWYAKDSMAGDEMVVNDGLGALNKNLFKFHPANQLPPKGEKRERPMKSRGIDTFMGSVIQVNTFFGRLAENKDGLTLNDSDDGITLKNRVIDLISSGGLQPNERGLINIPNAISVNDEPSTLRIHVLHAVAMAAVEELLNEIEEDK